MPSQGLSRLMRARQLACAAHADQSYGPYPYFFHLQAVVDLLQPFGETAQVIGYLHDVLEDTTIGEAELAEAFGGFVARAVALVSDAPGRTRAERKAQTHARLSRVEGPLELALVVKVADRLANVQACHALARPDKLAMYRKEQPAFRQAVHRPGLCDGFWTELEQLLG